MEDLEVMGGVYTCRQATMPGKRNKGRYKLFNDVAKLHGIKCLQCGIMSPFITLDHIIPRSKGGTDRIENLQILCLRDHRSKDNMRPLK
jgi:5-methylcytosine-specific restriction endonuclease McrA